jgi:membrane protease YdiL (CAAX protease family)
MLAVAGWLLVATLAVIVPLRGRARYAQFRRTVGTDPHARSRLFLHTLPMKYAVAAVATALYIAEAGDGHAIALIPPTLGRLAVAVPLLGGIALGAVRMHALCQSAEGRANVLHALRRVAPLVPRTPAERRAWVVASVSAGVTEELAYRAFAVAFFASVFGNSNIGAIAIASSALFGLAHLYQGWRGVLFTALLGALLTGVAVASGLVIAMVAHTLIDLRLLIVPRELAAAAEAETEPPQLEAPAA